MTFAIFFIFLISFAKGAAIAGVLGFIMFWLLGHARDVNTVHARFIFLVLAVFPGLGAGLGVTIMVLSLKYLGQFL